MNRSNLAYAPQTHVHTIDLERKWRSIREVLGEQPIAQALDVAMAFHCIVYDLGLWDVRQGPWAYSHPEFRHYHSVTPPHNSPDWYCCWGACHSLSVWCGAIGERLLPDRSWIILKGDDHSTAAGVKATGQGLERSFDIAILDILWGKYRDPMDILTTTLGGRRFRAFQVCEYRYILQAAVHKLGRRQPSDPHLPKAA